MKEASTPSSSAGFAPNLGLQEYLSLGYLYLLLLGLIGDVIYYKYAGINILQYASITDVLLAPINTLSQDLRLFGLVLGVLLALTLLYTRMLPAIHERNKAKLWYRKAILDMNKTDRFYRQLQQGRGWLTAALFFPCIFVGLKIGAGTKLQERLLVSDFAPTHALVFNDNRQDSVAVIGQNSLYLFYFSRLEKRVAILPIAGNLKEIHLLPRSRATR